MPDIRVFVTNIRKIAVTAIWAVIGFVVLFVDQATVGLATRTITSLLDTFGIQGLDKIVGALAMPSGMVMQAINALRLGAIIVKLVSIMIVAVPFYALYVLAQNTSCLPVAHRVASLSCAQTMHSNQNTYLLNDKIRC